MNHRSKDAGFVLIIVIGILGALAGLAVSLTFNSSQSAKLGKTQLFNRKAFLLARSGIERGLAGAVDMTSADRRLGRVQQISFNFGTAVAQFNQINVSVSDSSSRINLNDGIEAGREELRQLNITGKYNAQAIDPWPARTLVHTGNSGATGTSGFHFSDPSVNFTSLGLVPGDKLFRSPMPVNANPWDPVGWATILKIKTDELLLSRSIGPSLSGESYKIERYEIDNSALANLRLRRILNAYGDALLFLKNIGPPTWKRIGFNPNSDPTYKTSFQYSSTDAGTAGYPLPGRDSNGNPLITKQDIAANSTGLGDRIIASRPSLGYQSLNFVKTIVNQWGSDLMGNGALFESISHDLTVSSFIDKDIYRLKSPFNLGYISLDKANRPYSWNGHQLRMDSFPPDYGDLFVRHPTALINFNTCSKRVRAATLFAVTDVELIAEGTTKHSYTAGSQSDKWSLSVPTYGIRCTHLGHMENGIDNIARDGNFLSLRDSLCLSYAYEDYCQTNGFPNSFNEFYEVLYQLTKKNGGTCVVNERADTGWLPDPRSVSNPSTYKNRYMTNHNFNPSGAYYTGKHFYQDYVLEILPHVLGPMRRLPGYKFAPVALLSPLFRSGSAVLRAEDMVQRFHNPKVSFVNNGITHIQSRGQLAEGHLKAEVSLNTIYKIFDLTVIRNQKNFLFHTDMAATDSAIKIGPENTSHPPHDVFGVVGLRDRQDLPSSEIGPHFYLNYFNEDLNPESNSTFTKADSNNDPWIDAATAQSITFNAPVGDENGPNFSTPFDSDVLAMLRDTSWGSPQDTWRVPGDAGIVIQNFSTGWNVFPGLTHWPTVIPLNQIDKFLQDVWTVVTGFGMPMPPFPGLGRSHDEYLWLMSGSALAVPWTMWADTWSRGAPVSGFQDPEHETQLNAEMEDGTHSFFSKGQLGSDVSPFGGISFSSEGHGPLADGVFNDSLYFRPYNLMNLNTSTTPPQANQPTGATFNKGLISFWYREPSDAASYYGTNLGPSFWHGQKTLFDLTLWERVQLKDKTGSGANFATKVVYRPISISAMLRGGRVQFSHSVQRANSAYFGFYSLDFDDIEIPDIPFPITQADALSQTNYLGGPAFGRGPSWPSQAANLWPDSYAEDLVWNGYQPLHFPSGYVEDHYYDPKSVPGGWKRAVFSWDLSKIQNSNEEAFMSHVVNLKTNISSGSQNGLHRYSQNNKMILSIGDMALYFPDWSIGPFNSSNNNDLDKDHFIPYGRLNSTIDNLYILFGSTGGFSNRNQLDEGVSVLEADNALKTMRYDVSASSEPTWVLDPKFTEPTRVLSIEARVFDVPKLKYDPSDLGHSVNSPCIDLGLHTGAGPVSATASFAAPDRSISIHYYENQISAANTRFHLTYKNEDPAGNPLLPGLSNIPWIEEVAFRYKSGPASVVEWEQN